MLLRNLDADAGLRNGVCALIIHATPKVLDVLLVSGPKARARAFIPRLALAPNNPDLPFVLRRRQVPDKLAWCMTFNKAQKANGEENGLVPFQHQCSRIANTMWGSTEPGRSSLSWYWWLVTISKASTKATKTSRMACTLTMSCRRKLCSTEKVMPGAAPQHRLQTVRIRPRLPKCTRRCPL